MKKKYVVNHFGLKADKPFKAVVEGEPRNAPPLSPMSLIFMQFSAKKLLNNRLVTPSPPGVGATSLKNPESVAAEWTYDSPGNPSKTTDLSFK